MQLDCNYKILIYICNSVAITKMLLTKVHPATQVHNMSSDRLGAFASFLCLIHCLATLLLFVAQSCSSFCCEASPNWWRGIDYVFIVVSFIAVYRSSRITDSLIIARALWISFISLSLVILNETFHWISIPVYMVYIPAMALIILHLYNKKYCSCSTSCKLSD